METIKAVEMVRQIRDRQYELTKNMTIDEWIASIQQTAKEVNAEALEFLKQRHLRNNSYCAPEGIVPVIKT